MPRSSRKKPVSKDSTLRRPNALRDYMRKTSVGGIQSDGFFRLCLKASLAKCYEFNIAVRSLKQDDSAFFWIPALRGICEDLIVLKFFDGLPTTDREELIGLMMFHDVYSRVDSQSKFFDAVRPQQPVLELRDVEKVLAGLEGKIREVWMQHGWPNIRRGTMPPIRQIAERLGQSALATLYDYLYRFTSGTVHFSVQSLLRSGWGDSSERCEFSTTHFQPYFSAFASVYGAFLFCVFFESFDVDLQLTAKVSRIISAIRHDILLESRWPEMVTFEEMNIQPPEDRTIPRVVLSAIQAQKTETLLDIGKGGFRSRNQP
jgi:Family of unknown function (DUF5677)